MNARLVLFFGLRQLRLEFQQLFIMPILADQGVIGDYYCTNYITNYSSITPWADQVDCENATILITSNSQRNPTLCIVELAR